MARFQALVGLVLACAASARAEFKVAAIFGDHMVLQRGKEVPVWGRATSGEKVHVRFAGQDVAAPADAAGRWMVRLRPLATSATPEVLTVTGEGSPADHLEITDILVGEVWLCSGQSNMELTPPKGLLHPEEEIAKAHYPDIRLNLIDKVVSSHPLDEVHGHWTPVTPEAMRTFSAAAYFFAINVQAKLKIPIGLVGAYYGGSNAQAWTRREAFQADPDLAAYVTQSEASLAKVPALPSENHRPTTDRGPNSRYRPANFYNGMIAPLIPFSIRGVLWYQGEANTGNARDAGLYAKLFRTLIEDWRRQWGEGDFPFIFVQLPTSEPAYPDPTDSAWARCRESQERALRLPNTRMIVILDIGEGAVVHAHNKKQVGERLAATTLDAVYGLHDSPAEYPRFDHADFQEGKAVVHLSHAPDGVVLKPAAPPGAFAVAGSDRVFVWADARVAGNTIEVSSPAVPEPVAVRYAWADNPAVSLFAPNGLPAAPFRSDDWPAIKISNPRASP